MKSINYVSAIYDTHMSLRKHINAYLCIHIHTHVFAYVGMYIYMRVNIHIYTYVYMFKQVHT